MDAHHCRPMSILIMLCLVSVGCVPSNPQIQQAVVNKNLVNFTSFHDIHLTGVNISESLTVNGNLVIKNGQYNNIYVNGNSDISNTIVNGYFSSNGRLKLDKVAVKGVFNPTGRLEMIDSTIEKPITSNLYYLRLVNSSTKDIYVPKGNGNMTHIFVDNGSIVHGNITFASGRGIVEIQSGSAVMGTITGTVMDPAYVEVNINDRKSGGPENAQHGMPNV